MGEYTLADDLLHKVRIYTDPETIIQLFHEVYSNIISSSIEIYRILLLCSAVEAVHVALLNRLLEIGFDVNYKYGYGSPLPINFAIRLGTKDIVDLLVQAGASVTEEGRATADKSSQVYSAMEFIMVYDRIELLDSILQKYNKNSTRTKRTALHLACHHGAYKCLDYLLVVTNGVNTRDNSDPYRPEGYTPLMLGVHHGVPMVRLLLDHGADAKLATCGLRQTVLHLAVSPLFLTPSSFKRFVSEDLPEVIRILLSFGCNPNAVDDSGDTPLSLLCHQVTQELISREDVTHPYDIEKHQRVVYQSVVILLDSGADPNSSLPHLPLAVLIGQFDSILVSVGHDFVQLELVFPSFLKALDLVKQLFELLISRGASSDKIDPFSRYDKSIFQSFHMIVFRHLSTFQHLSKDRCSGIFAVIIDIYKLFFLSGAKFRSIESALQMLIYFPAELRRAIVQLYYNCSFDSEMREFKSISNKIVDDDQFLEPSNKQLFLSELEGKLLRPRSLKGLARVVVYSCLSWKVLPNLATLKEFQLPKDVLEYILLS